MSSSILPDAECPRRETRHEEQNLYHNRGAFQELVPQQEQHILDHSLPTPTHRPLRSNIWQRKYKVRPLRPKSGSKWKCADAALTRLRKRIESDWSVQPPHGRC